MPVLSLAFNGQIFRQRRVKDHGNAIKRYQRLPCRLNQLSFVWSSSQLEARSTLLFAFAAKPLLSDIKGILNDDCTMGVQIV